MCNKELDENLLTEGLNLFNERMASSYPDSDELKDVTFSERFNTKMKRLIVREKNGIVVFAPGFRRFLAVALVAAAILALSMTALASGENTDATFYLERRPFSNLAYIERYEPAEPQTNFYLWLYPEMPEINYIPEDFECTYDFKGSVQYANEKEEYITFSVFDLNGRLYVDLENTVVKEVRMNGKYALYTEKTIRFEGEKRIYRELTWEDNEYFCILNGNISKEELFKIAESVAWEK